MACAIGSAVLEVRASSHMAMTRVTKLQSHAHILITLSHHIIGEECLLLVHELKLDSQFLL